MKNNQRLEIQKHVINMANQLSDRKVNKVYNYGLQYSITHTTNVQLLEWEKQITNLRQWLMKLDVLGIGNVLDMCLNNDKGELFIIIDNVYDNIKIPSYIKNIKFKNSSGFHYSNGVITLTSSDSIYDTIENKANAIVHIERGNLRVPHDNLIELCKLTLNPLINDLKYESTGAARYLSNNAIRESFITRLHELFKHELAYTISDLELKKNTLDKINHSKYFESKYPDVRVIDGKTFIEKCLKYVDYYDNIYKKLIGD